MRALLPFSCTTTGRMTSFSVTGWIHHSPIWSNMPPPEMTCRTRKLSKELLLCAIKRTCHRTILLVYANLMDEKKTPKAEGSIVWAEKIPWTMSSRKDVYLLSYRVK